MPKKKKTSKTKAKRAKVKVKSRPKVKGRVKSKKEGPLKPFLSYKEPTKLKEPKGPKLTKSPFKKSELEAFRKVLTDLKKKIVGDLQQIEGETLNTSQKDSAGDLSGYSFHMADVATDSFDRELNIGIATSEQQLLNDVEDALKKIDDGTFGICERYGVAIPKKRLMVAPYVRLCLQAQEEEEKGPRRS